MRKSTHWRTLNNLTSPTRYSIPEMRGLHLWVRADVKKYWIFRFTYSGKRFDMSLGSFPAVSLSDAKSRTLKLRGMLFNGENPALARRLEKAENLASSKSISFKQFAEDYIRRMSPKWTSAKNEYHWLTTVNNFASPVIGHLDFESVTTKHILEILNPIWTSKYVTASRLRGRLEKIFSAAITSGYRSSPNPAIWKGHLENLLPNLNVQPTHLEALPYQDVPEFFAHLESLDTLVSLALRFTILNACRAGEVVQAEKSQIKEEIWTIPAERMKARREHQIPLTKKSLWIVERASEFTAESPLIFCAVGKSFHSVYMLNLANKIRTGITTHGFRSAFRDWVSEETNHSPEVAEMALAHAITNKVEAAYRRGKLLERRKILMTDWENYCLSVVRQQNQTLSCESTKNQTGEPQV
ncbi:site-specific integrase [Limnohabitans sp. TEGF004]|jgi:integrase|uniref:tyrosine-type recombinase/integrase n=1 Tax=Limnohabitans sp. TEGF004 TaxID=2986281 RepID=UPI0024921F16|nr:site-specific integrase [Limnohabitans sp. TEGF004]